jgi:hypothetical protein
LPSQSALNNFKPPKICKKRRLFLVRLIYCLMCGLTSGIPRLPRASQTRHDLPMVILEQYTWLGFAFVDRLILWSLHIRESKANGLHHIIRSTSFHRMHTSVSSAEGSLSSRVFIWLAIVNVVVAVIKFVGWGLPLNQRRLQLIINLASFAASIGILVVACSKKIYGMHHLCVCIAHTNWLDDKKHQNAYLGLLVGNCGLLVIYEVLGQNPQPESLRRRQWFIYGMNMSTSLIGLWVRYNQPVIPHTIPC